jgi:hypothetical protein
MNKTQDYYNHLKFAILDYCKEHGMPAGMISDGYHSFDELYDHRITLYISMLRQRTMLLPDSVNSEIWKSKVHSDGSVWDGWFILGIFKEPGKQITYHLPISRWNETDFAEPLDKAPDWDGHSSADVLNRLKQL